MKKLIIIFILIIIGSVFSRTNYLNNQKITKVGSIYKDEWGGVDYYVFRITLPGSGQCQASFSESNKRWATFFAPIDDEVGFNNLKTQLSLSLTAMSTGSSVRVYFTENCSVNYLEICSSAACE